MPRVLLLSLLLVWTLPTGRARAEEPTETWPRTISAVEIRGLWRTDGTVVTRELPWLPGDTVTLESWELGVQRLWNLGIFSRVQATVEPRDERLVAVFDLEERWTINILFRFGSAGTTGWVRVGAWDINTFGRYIETGGLYERFGNENGGQAWIRNPRLFDRRLDGQITLSRLNRPRLAFTTVRTELRLDLTNEFRNDFRAGVWASGMLDSFLHGPPENDQRPPYTKTLQFGPMARLGIVNTVRLRQTGWSFELRPFLAVTDRSAPFGGAWLEGLWFKMTGEAWTFAARVQAGAMSDALPQHHYYLTPLDHVRGMQDNFVETQAYGVVNLEARAIVFDSMWFAIMPAVFVDAAVARTLGGGAFGAASAGLGVRFMIPRIYRSGARIDAAWPLAPWGPTKLVNILSIGVYQFF